MAPHIVAQAIKTVTFCSAMMKKIGFESSPAPRRGKKRYNSNGNPQKMPRI